MKKRIAILLALVMVTPIVLTGCMTAEEQAAQREELDKIGKLAEEYMIDKYDRLFNVKKSEYAVGDEYKGNFFITFTDSTHAYYDADEEIFYDDRQADAIVEDIYSELWMPMIKQLGGCDAITQDTQNFCVKYKYRSGSGTNMCSLFHEYYYDNIKSYANKEGLSIISKSLYFVADDVQTCNKDYDYISEYVKKYFKNQSEGDFRVFVVSDEYHSSSEFDIASLDVANDGCIAEMRFGDINGITLHEYIEVEDGLYAMLCNYDSNVLEDGDVKLVQVSDSDVAEQKILNKIDENAEGVISFFTRTRNLSRETPIYRLEFSERIAEMLENGVTIAFAIKDGDKSDKYGFMAYDMNGESYNTELICNNSAQVGSVKINSDTDWYFWFVQN